MSIAEIVDSRGVSAKFASSGLTEPKGSSPFFGWIDPQGDPTTVRVESIAAIVRDARTSRFALILENTNYCPALTDMDAMRLMKRCGWTVPD